MSMIQAVTVFSSQGKRAASENHLLVEEDKGIFVISDGFGGPVPGAAASKAACEAVRNFLFKEAGDQDATLPFELRSYFSLAGNVLFNALIHANKKLVQLNRGKNVHEKGGASLLAGYLDDGLLALANVGTCTAWLIREDGGVELVAPRSYGRLLNPFVRDVHPNKQMPLMSLGVHKDLEPEISEYRVSPGDWILAHTEGLPSGTREELFRLRQAMGQAGQVSDSVRDLAGQRALKYLNEVNYDTDVSASLIFL